MKKAREFFLKQEDDYASRVTRLLRAARLLTNRLVGHKQGI